MDLTFLKEVSEYAGFITWPVVIVIFIFKIGVPLMNFYINKKNGNGDNIKKRFDALEQKANHEHSEQIADIRQDIGTLYKKIDFLSENQSKMREDISYLKAKVM